MKNTNKNKMHKYIHGWNIEVSNGKKYFVTTYHKDIAPKEGAWYLFEGDCKEDCITGECLESGRTKKELVNLVKFWNNID